MAFLIQSKKIISEEEYDKAEKKRLHCGDHLSGADCDWRGAWRDDLFGAPNGFRPERHFAEWTGQAGARDFAGWAIECGRL